MSPEFCTENVCRATNCNCIWAWVWSYVHVTIPRICTIRVVMPSVCTTACDNVVHRCRCLCSVCIYVPILGFMNQGLCSCLQECMRPCYKAVCRCVCSCHHAVYTCLYPCYHAVFPCLCSCCYTVYQCMCSYMYLCCVEI